MTRTYPVISVGLLLTNEAIDMMANNIRSQANSIPLNLVMAGDTDIIRDWLEKTHGRDLQALTKFSGTAETLDSVLCGEQSVTRDVLNGQMVFIPVAGEPVYTGTAPYQFTDDMVTELQDLVGSLLPADYPIAKYLCKIEGTYQC